MNEKQFEQFMDVMVEIAEQLQGVNSHLCKLGLAGADTQMGALELVAKELHGIKDNLEEIEY